MKSIRLHSSKCKFAVAIGILVIATAIGLTTANAFSLLGPYAPWMDKAKGYQQPDDIGGPMDIDEEYRWNVPVLTYGFDPSFIDYFGSNGVAAVEEAIQILNDLPRASDMVLTNFPTQVLHPGAASADFVVDVKLTTLWLLLEHMGLAQPSRYVFTFRHLDSNYWYNAGIHCQNALVTENCWSSWAEPYYITRRNFDPQTRLSSTVVDDIPYTGAAIPRSNESVTLVTQPIDFDDPHIAAIADASPFVLASFHDANITAESLSRDDAGGLQYLLSSNNVNFETLISGVHGAGTNADSWVNGAWRPGVEKITFLRQEYASVLQQATVPLTNRFTDTYISNGVVLYQQLERIISKPDILFAVADVGETNASQDLTWVRRTDASSWQNNAALNGDGSKAGPGVIQGPVQIVFNKIGDRIWTDYAGYSTLDPFTWGSSISNGVSSISYPVGQSSNSEFTVRFRLAGNDGAELFHRTWQSPVPHGGSVSLQVSSNLFDWSTPFVVSNRGAIVEWHQASVTAKQRYFRVAPQ